MEIFCNDYKSLQSKKVSGAQKYIVDVVLFADSNAATGLSAGTNGLIVDKSKVDNLPFPEKKAGLVFAPGSFLYCVADGELYICDGNEEFIKKE